ncbi:MAG: hypothetical protein N0C84_07705 [Candidatus Thiodiazotropha taylori]|uniref:Uncharacterized protein n=1 Tax=Candidatus Thiodiazotropha taylori TaxID=2792791 RepID=A0A9E4KBT0_9GAMM|nr:hypothetical protein [Candidatus Thiodiazotropha taylori]MCW4256337.1 hypothetical protein [Candidatus Thiodiazotropha taylori]
MSKTVGRPTAEDLLIERIAASQDIADLNDIAKLYESRKVECFSPDFINKAWSCYEVTVQQGHAFNGTSVWSPHAFGEAFATAWARHLVASAIRLRGDSLGLSMPPIRPGIICMYHFPLYPLCMEVVVGKDILVLVHREFPWAKGANIANVHAPDVARRIFRHLRAGGSVIAMVDYKYDMTRGIDVDFIGLPAQLPRGIFDLSHRMGLSIGLVTGLDIAGMQLLYKGIARVQSDTSETLAQKVANEISAEIVRSPPEWLMWPNFSHLWPFDPWKDY